MDAKPSELLERLLNGRDLNETEAAALMRLMGLGELAPALAGAVLAALRAKGETAAEIRGFATTMRELALAPAIPPGPYVDVVGTGGDGSGSLNLSTGSALLAAACGVPIVKHGNRSVSSRSLACLCRSARKTPASASSAWASRSCSRRTTTPR